SDAFDAIGNALHLVGVELGLADPTASTGAWRTFGAVIGGVVSVVAGVVAAAVRAIAQVLASLIQVVGGVVEVVAGMFECDWTRVWNGAKRVVFGLLTAVQNVAFGILDIIASLIDGLGKVAGKDLGLGRKLQGFKKDIEKTVAGTLGVGTEVVTLERAPAQN